MNYVNHVITEGSVTVIFNNDGTNEAKTVRSDNEMYKTIVKALRAKDYNNLDILCDKATYINKNSDGMFEVRNNVVYVGGDKLPAGLSKILINLVDTGCDITYLLKFWDNLKENPSARSIECLYTFLEANNCTITTDGCFIGYKAVRNDYMDKYSGKINNNIGEEPEMERSKVNDDPQHTCSFGLHVAAFDYAANSYGNRNRGDRLLAVKVNPKDVVAVPYDYHNTKIRVCKYKVVEDITDEWREKKEPLYFEEGSELEDNDYQEYCDDCGEYEDECTCELCDECGEHFMDCTCEDEEDEPKYSSYQAFVTKDGRIEIPQQAIKDYNIKSIKHVGGMEFGYSHTIELGDNWINANSNGRIVIPKSVVTKASNNSLNYQDETFIEVYEDGKLFL